MEKKQSLIQLIWHLPKSHTTYFPTAVRFKIGGLNKFQFVEFAFNAEKSYDTTVLRTFRLALCLLRVTIFSKLDSIQEYKTKA